MNKRLRVSLNSFFSLILLSFALTIPALAQVTTADITGRIMDQSGAAIANATVTIRNTGTGQPLWQTDEEGTYTCAVQPGNINPGERRCSRAINKTCS